MQICLGEKVENLTSTGGGGLDPLTHPFIRACCDFLLRHIDFMWYNQTGWVFLTSIDWFVCRERLKASACSVGKTLGYFQWLVPGVYMHFHRIRHAIYMVRFFCIDLQFLKIHSQNIFFHSNFGNFTIQIIYFLFNHVKYKFVKIFWNIMQYM